MKRSHAVLAALVALAGLLTLETRADDRIISPATGHQPAHSYSISDIETIDNASGNLYLHIPITQLPPGPGGFTAGLTLTYNNRYWETEPLLIPMPLLDTTAYPLTRSSSGGWHLAMTPVLEHIYIESLGTGDPCGNYSDLFQLVLTNPDGGRNHFLLSSPTQSMPAACEAGTYRRSLVENVSSVWYTADGSFLRLQMEAASGTGWPNNASWTVYRQDGASIHYDVATHLTYLRDHNGNKITISKTAGSTPYEVMTDDFGRSIRLDHYADRDEVSQTGHNGQPLVWKVYYGEAGAMTPNQYRCEYTYNWPASFTALPPAATSLELPNGLSYTFGYTPAVSTSSNYRELRTITLPTGAVVEYGYRLDTNPNPTDYYHILANTIKSKKVSIDGAVVENWGYDFPVNASTGAWSSSTITAPDGGVTNHIFNTIAYKYGTEPNAGIITKTIHADSSITQREWAYNAPYEKPASLSYPNPWVKRVLTSTANAAGTPVATSIRVFTADKNGNTTSVEERGWVAYSTTPPASSSAPLLRKTLTTYRNGAGDSANTGVDTNAYSYASLGTAALARNLVTSSELQNAGGAVKSRSQYVYTETNTTEHAWNPTAEYHWDSTKAASISPGTTLTGGNSVTKSYSYTARGNVSSETDARGATSTYEYGDITGCPPDNDTWTDLYRTAEHHGSYGGGSLLDYTYGYNCYSGKRTTTTDPNNLVTTVVYDNYGRPTATLEGGYRKTVVAYGDADRWVVTQSDVETYNDLRSVSVLHYDKLGRPRLARQLETTESDPAAAAADETTGIRVDTKYVFATNHRETWVSNPYRNSETTAPTRGWTVKRLDKAGRVCVEERFAGVSDPTVAANCTPSSTATGSTVYGYDATLNYTLQTVTDPAGKTRNLYHDVLGNLSAVREDPATAKYDTYYEYDLLGNLTFSRQAGSCSNANPVTSPCAGGQTRSFTYDSLARVGTATNPELGGNVLSYVYDDNGNVVNRLSSGSPSLLTTYTYDSLNRLQTLDYSDGTTTPVTYCYDGRLWNGSVGGCSGTPAAPSKGQLTEVGSTVSRMAYEYNAAGRITSSTQTTAGQSYEFGYTYTAGGVLASETYPSGRVVLAAYDDAGRAKYVKGQNGDVATYYAGNPDNAIQYASHGAISSMTLGNGIIESRTYNSSLQPTGIQAGSLLSILNCYQTSDDPAGCGSLPVAGNNGNVQRQKITRGSQSWIENYTYDAVNRLTAATETGVWSQAYGYDAYGNRWVSASSGVPVNPLTPTSSTNFNAATNRLTGSNTYDSRGNLTSYGAYTLVYDGEGRVVSAGGVTPSVKYEYDGAGNRVRAHSCPGNTACEAGWGANTTVFVYDAFGRLAAEYRAETMAASTSYYTQDHLGSTRLETDAWGQAVKCSDYVPFGEEIPAGVGGRASCFDENDNRVRYTGKERDPETGLDYFLARYYSGAHGRFTSPDPLMASAYIADPQTWNRYAYVRNNPINMIDPDGMDPITLNPSVFQYYQSMGWDTHEILNFFDSLPGANWSNSFYTYFDANLTAFYNHQYVDYWGQRNDQILYPTSAVDSCGLDRGCIERKIREKIQAVGLHDSVLGNKTQVTIRGVDGHYTELIFMADFNSAKSFATQMCSLGFANSGNGACAGNAGRSWLAGNPHEGYEFSFRDYNAFNGLNIQVSLMNGRVAFDIDQGNPAGGAAGIIVHAIQVFVNVILERDNTYGCGR